MHGVAMYQLVRKLKLLKERLKEMNLERYKNLGRKTEMACKEHEVAQAKLRDNQFDVDRKLIERQAYEVYVSYHTKLLKILQQKAKIRWAEGDANSRYYHVAIA